MKDQIFIALSTFASEDKRPYEMLEASGILFKIHQTGKRITEEELLRDGRDASVIVGGVEPYSAELMKALPNLLCISRCGVGVDAIDLVYARQNGISVLNTPMVPIAAVAELALTMMLSLSRNIVQQTNLMSEKKWQKLTGHLLFGRTVGIVGFGRIGQRVAKLCQAFGAVVIVYDPFIEKNANSFPDVRFVPMDILLSESNIVSLHASKDAIQPVIFGESEFAKMKDSSILINLARGEMVDEPALISALQSGKLSGVGLDVFGQEPYNGPLCEFKQVILTPHSATLTVETRYEMEMQCVENAISFLRGTVSPDRRVI